MKINEDKQGTPWCNFSNSSVQHQRHIGCLRGDCYRGGCENRTRKIISISQWLKDHHISPNELQCVGVEDTAKVEK